MTNENEELGPHRQLKVLNNLTSKFIGKFSEEVVMNSRYELLCWPPMSKRLARKSATLNTSQYRRGLCSFTVTLVKDNFTLPWAKQNQFTNKKPLTITEQPFWSNRISCLLMSSVTIDLHLRIIYIRRSCEMLVWGCMMGLPKAGDGRTIKRTGGPGRID